MAQTNSPIADDVAIVVTQGSGPHDRQAAAIGIRRAVTSIQDGFFGHNRWSIHSS